MGTAPVLVVLLSLSVLSCSPRSFQPLPKPHQNLEVQAWICPDEFLFNLAATALSSSSDVDWITSNVTAGVKNYRGSLWAVQTCSYERATADFLPSNNPGADLCFVMSSSGALLVVILRVSPT